MNRMQLEHGRYYGFGMDAVGIVCNWNTDVIAVWAWMPLAWLRKHVVSLGSLKKPGFLNALYPYVCICICVYMYICIYVYMYICIYVYICTCIYTHIYTHTCPCLVTAPVRKDQP